MVLCCFARNNKNEEISNELNNIFESYDEYNNSDYEEEDDLDFNNDYILDIENNIKTDDLKDDKLEKYKLDLNKYYLENLEKQMFMIENGYWKKNSKPWNGYFSCKNNKFPKYILKKYNNPPDFNNTFKTLYIDYNKVKNYNVAIVKKKNKVPEYNIIFQIKNSTKFIRYSYIFPEKNNYKIEDSLKFIIEIFKNNNNKIMNLEKKINSILCYDKIN
tara:strand:+ start:127 stop:777 length:651 start_codon:yes stop_codon:yes gene_type:complete